MASTKAARVGEEYATMSGLKIRVADRAVGSGSKSSPPCLVASACGTTCGLLDLFAICLIRIRTRVDKVNAELVTLTYGTMVAQLCSDFDSNYAEVNKQLDKMGYNIGMRLVEDFFAKSGTQRCANLRETAEMISKVRVRPWRCDTGNITLSTRG